jgi:hypothetical protein
MAFLSTAIDCAATSDYMPSHSRRVKANPTLCLVQERSRDEPPSPPPQPPPSPAGWSRVVGDEFVKVEYVLPFVLPLLIRNLVHPALHLSNGYLGNALVSRCTSRRTGLRLISIQDCYRSSLTLYLGYGFGVVSLLLHSSSPLWCITQSLWAGSAAGLLIIWSTIFFMCILVCIIALGFSGTQGSSAFITVSWLLFCRPFVGGARMYRSFGICK